MGPTGKVSPNSLKNKTLAQGYDPYGTVTSSSGTASSYGFTNEYQNSYIKLIYLRSRIYSSFTGRFLTRDTWDGDASRSLSFDKWAHVLTLSSIDGLQNQQSTIQIRYKGLENRFEETVNGVFVTGEAGSSVNPPGQQDVKYYQEIKSMFGFYPFSHRT
jgi:RHS repeat-associated protein